MPGSRACTGRSPDRIFNVQHRQPRVVEGSMAKSVTPFLMFEGAAEAAANLYVSLFRNSLIEKIERYGPGEQGAEGKVKQCHFIVAGLPLRCFDSPIKHPFTFTPSVS